MKMNWAVNTKHWAIKFYVRDPASLAERGRSAAHFIYYWLLASNMQLHLSKCLAGNLLIKADVWTG